MSEDEDLLVEDLEDGNDLETFEENRAEDATEDQGETNEDGTAEEDKKTVKPKRVIRNPQPKLNAETLKGKRGLTALPSYFDRVKFKGRGYEEQDLDVILKTYEYWCHRLFPKYPFDECISKIETLGAKKAVMTHVKRIRLDMVFEDQAIVDNDREIIDDPDSETEMPNDQFDELVHTGGLQPPEDVSEEQLARIRLNKERAERIRRERLRQNMEIAGSSQENHELGDFHTEVENNVISLWEETSNQTEPVESQSELCDDNNEKNMEVSFSPKLITPNDDLNHMINTGDIETPSIEDIHE